jgi:glucosamine 6-phosphate synthetase-like amidotransferase/phosphosugar isomerase protein
MGYRLEYISIWKGGNNMCGLYGCLTKTDHNNRLSDSQKELKVKILSALAVAMESRGEDSTGIAIVKDGENRILKAVVKSSDFIATQKFASAMCSNPEIILGHTRLATHGAVTENNAHPFKKGNIIGAHNGMVSNYLKIDNKVQVDSEVIFGLLDECDNKFEKAFKELSGSFAITWLNMKEPSVMYFVASRNPLAFVSVPEIKSLFWVSTALDLKIVLQATVGLKNRNVWEPKENTVYRIDAKTLKVDKYKVKFKKDNTNAYTRYGTAQDITDYGQVEYETYAERETMGEIVSLVEYSGCELCGRTIDNKEGFYFDETTYRIQCGDCRKIEDPHHEEEEFVYIDEEEYEAIKDAAMS